MNTKKLTLAQKLKAQRLEMASREDNTIDGSKNKDIEPSQAKANSTTSETNIIGKVERQGVSGVAANQKYRALNTDDCRPWAKHDRSKYWLTPKRINTLTKSIRDKGQKQLGLVRVVKDNDGSTKYEIIFGVRRWYACKLLALPFKAMIAPEGTSDTELMEIMDDENAESEDITELERVASYTRAIDDGFFTKERLIDRKEISTRTYYTWIKAGSLYKYPCVWEKLEPIIIGVSLRSAVKLADTIGKSLTPEEIDNIKKIPKPIEPEQGDLSFFEHKRIVEKTATGIIAKIIAVLRRESKTPPEKDKKKIKMVHQEQHGKAILQSTYNPDNGSSRITIEKELVMKSAGDPDKMMNHLREVVGKLSEKWRENGLTDG